MGGLAGTLACTLAAMPAGRLVSLLVVGCCAVVQMKFFPLCLVAATADTLALAEKAKVCLHPDQKILLTNEEHTHHA
jgi:hypothetical protein